MIEGERVVTAMAFTILRIHRKKLMAMIDMDEMTQFLQIQLHKNFGYDDDFVIKLLEQSMADLKKYKMDLPPPPQQCELPKYEFGRFIEPEFETKVGRRKTKFTEIERRTTETVILRYTFPPPHISNAQWNSIHLFEKKTTFFYRFCRQEGNIQNDIVSNYSSDNNADENLGKLFFKAD